MVWVGAWFSYGILVIFLTAVAQYLTKATHPQYHVLVDWKARHSEVDNDDELPQLESVPVWVIFPCLIPGRKTGSVWGFDLPLPPPVWFLMKNTRDNLQKKRETSSCDPSTLEASTGRAEVGGQPGLWQILSTKSQV